MALTFTGRAREEMAERPIPVDWVELAVTAPELRTDDPNDPHVERLSRRVPERGGLAALTQQTDIYDGCVRP